MKARVALILGAVAFLLIGVVLNGQYGGYRAFSERLTGLAGVKLGSTRTELLYKHGQPTHVAQEEVNQAVSWIELPAGRSAESFKGWAWRSDEMVTEVVFGPTGRVGRVGCYTRIQIISGWWCATVGGVSTTGYDGFTFFVNSSESNARNELGLPDRVTYSTGEGPVVKVVSYDDLDLRLWFISERLERIEKGPKVPSFWWWLFEGPSAYGT